MLKTRVIGKPSKYEGVVEQIKRLRRNQALEITPNGEGLQAVRVGVYATSKREGLRLVTSERGGRVVVWKGGQHD